MYSVRIKLVFKNMEKQRYSIHTKWSNLGHSPGEEEVGWMEVKLPSGRIGLNFTARVEIDQIKSILIKIEEMGL